MVQFFLEEFYRFLASDKYFLQVFMFLNGWFKVFGIFNNIFFNLLLQNIPLLFNFIDIR